MCFCLPKSISHYTLYTQYIIMLCMCIVQRNLGQVMISGIEACMCMQYFVIIDRAFVAFCYVTGMCRMIKNNVVNSSFRTSSVALIRRLWMQVLLHVVWDSVLERLRIIKFKSKVKHQPANSMQHGQKSRTKWRLIRFLMRTTNLFYETKMADIIPYST